jgi:hypothetical protein
MRHPECKGGTARLRHKIDSDRVGLVGNLRPIGNRPYKRRRITNPPQDAILPAAGCHPAPHRNDLCGGVVGSEEETKAFFMMLILSL